MTRKATTSSSSLSCHTLRQSSRTRCQSYTWGTTTRSVVYRHCILTLTFHLHRRHVTRLDRVVVHAVRPTPGVQQHDTLHTNMTRKATTSSSSPPRHTHLARVAVHTLSDLHMKYRMISTYRVVQKKTETF